MEKPCKCMNRRLERRGRKKNAKYGLVMKDLVYHSFPPKVLQRQKRYLRRGLYKTCDTKIIDFICHIYEMVN